MKAILNMSEAKCKYVKNANWIIGEHGFYYCSECGNEAYWDTDYGQQLFKYCQNCGAKMNNAPKKKRKK